ncbi:MAG: hypothetical protein FJ271_23955 [Planctomycetes bacterium]|nr:hypothetical protein [Planctomycetota bacterium]
MADDDRTEAERVKPPPVDGRTERQSTSGMKRSSEQSRLPQDLTQPQNPTDIVPPHKLSTIPQVPGYELLGRLGSGSYGEVWRAREMRTGIEVAIKFLVHGAGLPWQLLQAEVKQLAMLHADPGIVQLIDVEPAASPPFYIMEYLQQGSLARRLEKGPLPVGDALKIFVQMTEALAYVHAKGIRHCDLKPANVLLDARGRAKLADFGQAHLSSDASPALGTFFYMAPEQADLSKQIPDTRWDVYALGALFYTMVTGRPPREDSRIRDQLAGTEELSHRLQRYREWVQHAPEPRNHRGVAGMDRHLADIIDRCLALDPAKRWPDAAAVLDALERRQRLRRQRPLLAFGVIAPLLLLLVMAGLGSMMLNESITRSEEALASQLDKLLESDLILARVVARAVEEELLNIKRTLIFKSRREELRLAVKQADRRTLTALLKENFERTSPGKFGRWVVTDRHGKLLACFPIDKSIYGVDFGWRGWFNGEEDRPDERQAHFEPARETVISQPFIGQSLERPLTIAVSTPIWDDKENGHVAGVLMATVHLDEIHHWLDERARMDHGFIALINENGQFLHHRERDKIKPKEGENPVSHNAAVFRDVLAGKEGSRSHDDPLDGKTYLTAYAPLPRIGWGALVQHDSHAALEPINALKESLNRYFWIGLAAIGVLISVLWGALLITLRHSARVPRP